MAFAFVLALFAQDADAAIENFKSDFKAKRAAAVEELAKVQHAKVTRQLATLLVVDEKDVRIAAAKGLGARSDEKEKKLAAAALAEAIKPNEKESEVVVAILAALGKLRQDASAAAVHAQFDAEKVEVARAAVEAAGEIRCRESIEPLIELAKDLEEILKEGPGQGGGKLPGRAGPRRRVLRSGSKEEREEARALAPAVRKALVSITGVTFQDPKEYEAWWKEHKATFKVPPR